mmetsp:Transcript_18581/g.27248  ORF Transcript_18581/g.27248 Transcript_18581/m.27248 type:complete len:84 (-) Transcript_18581:119-370(-)
MSDTNPSIKSRGAASKVGGARRGKNTASRNRAVAQSTTRDPNQISQYETDDATGLQFGPTTILVMSLGFIGFVILLHIFGKFR